MSALKLVSVFGENNKLQCNTELGAEESAPIALNSRAAVKHIDI
jgi:hypothetical protein